MRGSIKQRSKGSWTIILDAGRDPATGKRRQQWHTVKGTKREAEKRLSELIHQVDTGEYASPSKVTVGAFLSQWLRDYAWPNLSAETAQGYDIMARTHLIPTLGNIPLQRLTSARIQSYYTEKLTSGRRDGKGGIEARRLHLLHLPSTLLRPDRPRCRTPGAPRHLLHRPSRPRW